MNISDTDKEALISNIATIPFKINILKDREIIKTLDEHSIVNLDIEDFRYVDTDSLVVGQFVEKKITGNLDKIYTDFELENTEVELEMGISHDDTTTYYSLGNYLITKPSTDDVKDKTSFEGFDYAKKFNQVFNPNGLTFPCSALQLATYCCNNCGVELGTTDFTNYDFIITGNQYDSDATYRDVMKDIGKLAYSWVRIGWDNKCYIDFTAPSSDINDYNKIDGDHYYELKTQEKVYGPINRIIVGLKDVEGENVVLEDADSINKNGAYELKIYDNNLTNTPELRQKVLDSGKKLFGITFLPLEITTTGHPWLTGDEMIEITTPDGKVYQTIPFDRTITYSGHIKTKLVSKAETIIETEYKNTKNLETDVKKTRYIVDKQNQIITQVVEKQDKYETQQAEIDTKLDSISSNVTDIVDLTREASGGTVSTENAKAGYLLALHIYGNITSSYPRNTLYPSTSTYPRTTTYLLSVIHNESNDGEEKTIIEHIELPFNYLLSTTDVHDEFVYDMNDGCYLIRRLKIDESGNIVPLDTEERIRYNNIPIPVYDGVTKYSLENYSSTLYIRYAIQSDLTDVFATKVELQSSIKQSRDEINLEISKKVDANDIINAINLSSEGAKINANKIELTGDFINVNTYKLNINSKDGNPQLNINSREINFIESDTKSPYATLRYGWNNTLLLLLGSNSNTDGNFGIRYNLSGGSSKSILDFRPKSCIQSVHSINLINTISTTIGNTDSEFMQFEHGQLKAYRHWNGVSTELSNIQKIRYIKIVDGRIILLVCDLADGSIWNSNVASARNDTKYLLSSDALEF